MPRPTSTGTQVNQRSRSASSAAATRASAARSAPASSRIVSGAAASVTLIAPRSRPTRAGLLYATCLACSPQPDNRSTAQRIMTDSPRGAAPPRPLRPFPHRVPAHRRRAHGALQLALRPPCRRPVPAAHRGHRSRAQQRGGRGGDPRRPPLARARLGGRAGLPVRSWRPSQGGGRGVAGARQRLPLLPHPGRARRPAQDCGGREAAAHHPFAVARRRPRRGSAGTPFVIRLKAPREGETVIDDRVQGRVRSPTRISTTSSS